MTSGLVLALSLAWPAAAASPVAGTVVTSKEWLVRRGKGQAKEEEFIGEVRYHAGPNSISADWALFSHAAQRWRARGRVLIHREDASGDVFEARGDEATLDEATQAGTLSARQRVTFERRAAAGGVDDGEAGYATWEGRQSVDLTGVVHAWGPRLESWADAARYEGQRVTLTGGRPVVGKLEALACGQSPWRAAVKADTIVALQEQRLVTAEGRAVGWVEFPRK